LASTSVQPGQSVVLANYHGSMKTVRISSISADAQYQCTKCGGVILIIYICKTELQVRNEVEVVERSSGLSV